MFVFEWDSVIPFSTWESRGVSGSACVLWRGLLSKVQTV